jgi:hypothetical protein
VAILAAMAALAGGIAELVTPAAAESPVNRAPAQARRASTVRFSSSVQALVDGRHPYGFSEHGSLDFARAGFRAIFSVPGGGTPVERRRVGRLLYVTTSAREGSGRSSRSWVAVPITPGGVQLGGGYTVIDPAVVFKVLEGARHVHDLGTARIGGEPITHYRLASNLNEFLRAQYGTGYRPQYTPPSGVLDVWLDREGRPLRVQGRFSAHTAAGQVTLVLTSRFAGYGQAIRIAAPTGPIIAVASAHSEALLHDPTQLLARVLFGKAGVRGTRAP